MRDPIVNYLIKFLSDAEGKHWAREWNESLIEKLSAPGHPGLVITVDEINDRITVLDGPNQFRIGPLWEIRRRCELIVPLTQTKPPTLLAQEGEVNNPLSLAVNPPTLAHFLLALFLSKTDRQTIPGDLEEEFHTSILPKFGPRRAKLWYWSQTLTTIVRCNPLIKWAFVGGGILKVFDWITRRITG